MRWRGVTAAESDEQIGVMQWAEAAAGRHRDLELLHAIPNGGHRHPAVAGRMKAEGVKKGMLDLCLPSARGGYFGLYVEMKRGDGTGRVEREQRWWIERLREQGYAVHVAVGTEEAIRVIQAYVRLPPTPRAAPPGHSQD